MPPAVRIGALAPLSRPGWVEAGEQLIAGMHVALDECNAAGGIGGAPLELLVRDTAADPARAEAAVDELAGLGVAALAGEYHSVVARTVAARAAALGLPFLCSSAVLDALTDEPTDYVARIAPAQAHGWQRYAEFLLDEGHTHVAVATQRSVYWSAGTRILRDHFAARGGDIVDLDTSTLQPTQMCDRLAAGRATAVLLLVGHPEPAVSLVRAARRDARLDGMVIGAPAGQPEFDEWARLCGADGAGVPFLRYLPDRLNELGARVGNALRERTARPPSFVAFEGYDTIAVLAEMLRTHGAHRERIAASWPHVAVDGTRGRIEFSRAPSISVWQWRWAPVQIVERDPADVETFRIRGR